MRVIVCDLDEFGLVVTSKKVNFCDEFPKFDGLIKCEKWIPDDDSNNEESRATWWLSRLLSRPKKVTVDW
ncbi:hypothetical protein SOVF_010680 isoform A [Spinacia oleracea]|nr:hypothetical protein SOVF_010680 isoform A [Spinacia oleracea]